jgi:hypothetical protein
LGSGHSVAHRSTNHNNYRDGIWEMKHSDHFFPLHSWIPNCSRHMGNPSTYMILDSMAGIWAPSIYGYSRLGSPYPDFQLAYPMRTGLGLLRQPHSGHDRFDPKTNMLCSSHVFCFCPQVYKHQVKISKSCSWRHGKFLSTLKSTLSQCFRLVFFSHCNKSRGRHIH